MAAGTVIVVAPAARVAVVMNVGMAPTWTWRIGGWLGLVARTVARLVMYSRCEQSPRTASRLIQTVFSMWCYRRSRTSSTKSFG